MNGLVVSLTLCLLNPAPGPVAGVEPRQCFELATYDSKSECRITAERVKVHARGARLSCIPRELSPDELRGADRQRGWAAGAVTSAGSPRSAERIQMPVARGDR